MTRREIIHRNSDTIRAIAARCGAENVRLFGSVARGDERPDSDVDFLVCFRPGRTLLDHGGLLMDLQDLLGFKVDVLSEAALKGRAREEILREAVRL